MKRTVLSCQRPFKEKSASWLTVIISKSVKLTLASKSDFSKEGK